jgi:DNA-binding GntR family transcriptional regulator
MKVTAIQKGQSLSDQAMDKLIELIMNDQLLPGERIQEATLARQLGISRGPLREAISRLEGRHLLQRLPHIGVRVADPTPAEIGEAYLIREALEALACRMAAERITDQELDRLEEILGRHFLDEDAKVTSGYYQASSDRDFHLHIARATGSQRLENMLMGDIYQLLLISRHLKRARTEAAYEEHRVVLDALRRRDPDAADAAMRTHIRNASRSVVEAIQQAPTRGLP